MSFLIGFLLLWMLGSDYTSHHLTLAKQIVGPQEVGQLLFTRYLLLVEVAAMLLLGALVAAFHLGKRDAPTQGDI